MTDKLKAFSLLFTAFSLLAIDANAAPEATSATKSNASAAIDIRWISPISVRIISSQTISYILIQPCHASQSPVKYENLDFTNDYTFSSANGTIKSILVKAGTSSSESAGNFCPVELAPTEPVVISADEGPAR